VDWEYPSTAEEGANLVDTCRLIRQELDNYASSINGNPHFLLTLSVPAGPDNYRHFDVPGFDPYVDFINLMAYDYQGAAFSNYSGHAQNVYKSQTNPLSTDFDTKDPVTYYLDNGLDPKKLTLGMPLYGRSFADTDGPGTVFGNTTDGSWEPGVWDYKVRGTVSSGNGESTDNA
jgi:chitinase